MYFKFESFELIKLKEFSGKTVLKNGIEKPYKVLKQNSINIFTKGKEQKWDLKIITWNVCSIQEVFINSSIDLEHQPFHI